jgi:hypothetical protein
VAEIDQVATYLAEANRVVHDRYANAGERAAFAPRLLAAVEAVLATAADWQETIIKLDAVAERAADNGQHHRTCLLNGRAQAHEDNVRAVREAISRVLLGEGESGG